MAIEDVSLTTLLRTIAAGDGEAASRMLVASPVLATARSAEGATRKVAGDYFLSDVGHHVYAGDTALHIAAAAYQVETVRMLIARGADVRAANRRGAQPLHYAADGRPGSRTWHASAQAETVACLIESGADPNAVDWSGVTPLHRAVRTRCEPAVRALLEAGADAQRLNKSGSTPMQLALSPTGRGGAGEPPAKAQQREIIDLLHRHGGRGPNAR